MNTLTGHSLRTDRVENWHQLGFIVQRPSYGPEPISIETLRGDIHRPKKSIRPNPHSLGCRTSNFSP